MGKPVMLASFLLAAMILAACAAPPPPVAAPAAEAPAEAATPATESAAPAAETPASLDAQAAVDVALAAIPDGAVIDIESGMDRLTRIWEVVVRNANGRTTELYIDAATGAVIKLERGDVSPLALSSAPAVTISEAMATALATTPGTVEEVSLEKDRTRTVWEVKVAGDSRRQVEHYIDAATGELVKLGR